MKYLLITMFFIVARFQGHAQSPAEIVAGRILQKMTDTLSLNNDEVGKIDSLNKLIFDRKTLVRQQFTDRDSLRVYIQRVERSRDTLYQQVLPEPKYLLYKEKKATLISN
jgi:hypothetical protein